jgi:hypothetical protein
MAETALRLPRTIRLDPSDGFVFARAAEPGEWAVTGTFLFLGADHDAFSPKQRAAFRSGFLGTRSFGWSTLAIVTSVTKAEREAAIAELAAHLLAELGAPDEATARAAAEEEIAFAASLCNHPPETLLALHRQLVAGEIREQFRTLVPRTDRPADVTAVRRVFTVVETDEPEETVEEQVDLLALGGGPATKGP